MAAAAWSCRLPAADDKIGAMKVSEIMTRELVTLDAEDAVTDVAAILVENGINGAPVVDGTGRLLGMVTLADLVVRNAHLHFPRYIKFLDSLIYLEDTSQYDQEVKKALAITAGELMSTDVETVDPDTEIEDAATKLFEEKINALPVVENGRVVGIVSRFDLVKLMVRREEPAS
jgi:CBS domain-containing protein